MYRGFGPRDAWRIKCYIIIFKPSRDSFSSVSYASLRPYLQLDTRSNSGTKISEGGLAENIVLDMDIQPQDNIFSTNITNAPSLFSSPSFSSTFEFSLSTKKINPYEIRDTRGCGTLYFNRLRQLLIDKILAVKNRTTSVSDKNRQTKTFIRFCSRPHVIYLGYYFACGFVGKNNQCCQQPAAVVLSHNRRICNNHLPRFIIHGNKGRRTGKLPQNPSFYVHNRSYIPHNHAKEVHST
ncbi:hypothetical protein RhiirC2_857846 [Rhizophagus irregularis]|uniref:Uncharacterized protein n=1 Tax=Rhizophagus irregularis TaxID=588596 RepID=A0A2N1M9M3_9GLOM|nr:hypothetical protein RhiirC2_857846 [Rhizophagus irregularis]